MKMKDFIEAHAKPKNDVQETLTTLFITFFLINYPHFPFPQPVNLDFTAWFLKEIGDSNAFSIAKIGQNRSKL